MSYRDRIIHHLENPRRTPTELALEQIERGKIALAVTLLVWLPAYVAGDQLLNIGILPAIIGGISLGVGICNKTRLKHRGEWYHETDRPPKVITPDRMDY